MKLVKAHAYGNDFLLAQEQDVPPDADRAALARALCERHRGVGGDGLITYADGPRGARMQLLNADGSYSEVSGNGVRCLAAWLARMRAMQPRQSIEIETDAGIKTLQLLEVDGNRLTFRASMGQPEGIRQQSDRRGRRADRRRHASRRQPAVCRPRRRQRGAAARDRVEAGRPPGLSGRARTSSSRWWSPQPACGF